jgi:hypothetical protein
MEQIDTERRVRKSPRKGDGGVYLVIVDDTPEFQIALRYAARCAESRRGHVALLHVFDVEDFQDWGNIEKRLLDELRIEAEARTRKAAAEVFELTQKLSAIYITEGHKVNKIIEIISHDDSLVCLVLGGGVTCGNAGPLISHFTGKALGKLRVPVIVVPGNLDLNRIDAIT